MFLVALFLNAVEIIPPLNPTRVSRVRHRANRVDSLNLNSSLVPVVATSTCRSRPLAVFRCLLSRGAWLLASYHGSFSLSLLFGCGFDWSQQFHLGLFRRAMVAMLQRLDARSFLLRS